MYPTDRYGHDVLSRNPHEARRPTSRRVEAALGLLIEDVQTGFVGEVVRVGKVAGIWHVELEGRGNITRSFPMGRGFWIEGQPVELLPPAPTPAVTGRLRTASGSVHVEGRRARVARSSRIWVEGKHDAELIQRVWGEDLAVEGVVVEELRGVDNLKEALRAFGPSDTHRAGILVDHLVKGSKEWRIAREVSYMPGVLVLGHPYVDVWQAIKPSVVGLMSWPEVPKGEDIKVGTLARLGWPHDTSEDVGRGWARILDKVHSYRDLEPSLLGRMEELIDFVTAIGTS